MFCKYCGKELPDNAVFCSKCGKQLAVKDKTETDSEKNASEIKHEETTKKFCKYCGAINAASAKFCSKCGKTLVQLEYENIKEPEVLSTKNEIKIESEKIKEDNQSSNNDTKKFGI